MLHSRDWTMPYSQPPRLTRTDKFLNISETVRDRLNNLPNLHALEMIALRHLEKKRKGSVVYERRM